MPTRCRTMDLSKLTEEQENFVVSKLIAFKHNSEIARRFMELYPHFNNGEEKAKIERGIIELCVKYTSNPKTPQYKIIWQERQCRDNDVTDILLTHQHYRDHLRQNLFDRIEDMKLQIKADGLDNNPRKVKCLIDCIHLQLKTLNDMEKRK